MNVAVTVLLAFMVTEHLEPLVLVQPDQEVRVDPPAGLAVRVTEVPGE